MMPELISSSTRRAILGLGTTGRSVARFWKAQGIPFVALDTRSEVANDLELRRELAGVEMQFGDLSDSTFEGLDLLIASPGIAMDSPELISARQAGVEIRGDIDLFVAEANKPVIGITGSNGKSTVTTFVGQLLEACGLSVAVGGNLGTGALDLLGQDVDVFVLELSSFQLERAGDLNLAVATVLNLTPDHLDRHETMPLYHLAKHRIFAGAKHVAVNARDPLTLPVGKGDVPWIAWRDDEPDLQQLGIRKVDGEPWIAFGFDPLVRCTDLPVTGAHNVRNVLAALAISRGVGLEFSELITGVGSLRGLPHRCESIAEVGGVSYVNDSKATNVGATVSALGGLARGGNIILIAGGQAKGQSFQALKTAVEVCCKHVLLIGEAAAEIAENLPDDIPSDTVESLTIAVETATHIAGPGDVILLSPACASFDMFDNYQHRGDVFREAVLHLRNGALS